MAERGAPQAVAAHPAFSFDRFVRWNIRQSARLTPAVEERTHPYPRFDALVADILNRESGMTVVDVGAGRHCDYATLVPRGHGNRMIGVDVSERELAHNEFLDDRVVADACALPQDLDGAADLLVSKATMEHLPDNAAFLSSARRVLKPGGVMILVFTSRNAPFALINRALPERVSGMLLARLAPVWAGQVGFKTHYDRTNASAFRAMLKDMGFETLRFDTGYFSSAYFRFLVPAYLLALGYDLLRHGLKIEALGSYHLVVARKPA